VDKYQIAAAILEKLFYAYLFFVVAVCVVICLVCQYYDVHGARMAVVSK
jgi:hypothetical protein